MIFSFAFVCEHESSIGGYKGPTMYKGEHESSICGYKGPTMFYLDLLRTLGQVWVSLGTSQVLWYLFGLHMSLIGS